MAKQFHTWTANGGSALKDGLPPVACEREGPTQWEG